MGVFIFLMSLTNTCRGFKIIAKLDCAFTEQTFAKVHGLLSCTEPMNGANSSSNAPSNRSVLCFCLLICPSFSHTHKHDGYFMALALPHYLLVVYTPVMIGPNLFHLVCPWSGLSRCRENHVVNRFPSIPLDSSFPLPFKLDDTYEIWQQNASHINWKERALEHTGWDPRHQVYQPTKKVTAYERSMRKFLQVI